MKQWMRRAAAWLVLGVVLAGCDAGRFDDYRALLRRELALMEEFNAGARKAADAASLREALQKLNAGLEELSAAVGQFTAAHPDLAALSPPPAELRKEYDELGGALNDADKALLMKEKLFDDPLVKAELEKLIELQAALGLY